VLVPADAKIAFARRPRLQRSPPYLGQGRSACQASRHGAAARRIVSGAERIAARWADHRKLPQIVFKPDWTRHAKAAPFNRNGLMLDVLPIGVLVFASTGIQANLADEARKLWIPVLKFGNGGA
jgi:hypothetical protein